MDLIDILQGIATGSAVFVLAYMLLGVLAGFLGLCFAWFGDVETAKWLGWLCAVPGGGICLLLVAGSAALGNPYPGLFAIPAILGGLTLAHVYSIRETARRTRFQFTIPTVLYVTLLTALFALAVRYVTSVDQSERLQYLANLQRMDNISNIQIYGEESFRRITVQRIQFSLANRPDTLVAIDAAHSLRSCRSNDSIKYLLFTRIGPWRLKAQATDKVSGYVWNARGFETGTAGKFRDKFPFAVASIDDIVEHYDEIVAILESWPRESEPGRWEDEYIQIDYWVERDDDAHRQNNGASQK